MRTRTGIARFVLGAAVAVSAAAPGEAQQSGGPPPAPIEQVESAPEASWAALPDDLAPALEAKSAGYARRALKFSCRERIREAEYEGREARRESFQEYDYLLIGDANAPGGFTALRTKPGATDADPENVDLPFPEAFTWSALFDPRVRSLLRFQVGEWHTTPWRLAIPIYWVSSAPVLEKRRITEWTGVVEAEYGTGNLIRVVARPSLQDERIQAELDRYLTSFRFLGFSTAPSPEGLELIVDFDYEHEGFTYPTRIELVTFRQAHQDERQVVTRRVVEYSQYRFFGTRVQDEIPPLKWRAPEVLPPLEPKP